MAKFNDGDFVKYGFHKAKVISTRNDSKGTMYDVEFCNPTFTNNRLIVDESSLSFWFDKPSEEKTFSYKALYSDPDISCPNCGGKWKETHSPVHGKRVTWYDCVGCNKTKEDILEENHIDEKSYNYTDMKTYN